MRLIIGGAYQGKTRYAAEKYGLADSEIISGEMLDGNIPDGVKCVNDLHLYIKKIIADGGDPIENISGIISRYPEIIFIMNEIGNGIIPMERTERIWREQVGRTGCFLAGKAESVERLICGMAVRIK